MKCPRCENAVLDERERDGVTVDVCQQCRGIWLDRSELERIVARAMRESQELEGRAPVPQAPPPSAYPPPHYPPPQHRHRDRDDDTPPHGFRHGGGYYPKRKKHWLSEIFD